MFTPPLKSLLAALLVIHSAQSLADLAYTITDLGSFSPVAINNSGQIAGNFNSNGTDHAALYSNGTLQDIGNLGGTLSDATGINNSGQVVGYSNLTGDAVYHAFLYSGGSMSDLGSFGGTGTYSWATGINDSGQIVGNSYFAGGYIQHAFLYSGGTMQDLSCTSVSCNNIFTDTFGHGTAINTWATSINSSGQTVGFYSLAYSYPSVTGNFLSSGGSATFNVLPYPVNGHTQELFINNSGQIAGNANIIDGRGTWGFLYSGGILTDNIGGVVYGINNYGQIVGAYTGYNLPFLYQNGTLTDLQSLFAGTGFYLMSVRAINDVGQIVGYGTVSTDPTGAGHAFLLNPTVVPIPAAVWLFGSALAALGLIGKRRPT